MSVSHRPVEPRRDSDLLHGWVTQDRATFWGMTETTRDEVEEIYTYIQSQEHLAAYLVHWDDQPVALYQTYDPAVDEIGEHYDREPGDLGAHFFMAPDKRPWTGSVIRYILEQLFAPSATSRVVVEPDARNARAVGLMRRIGFELGPRVELPHKPAQFAFLTRAAYDGLTLSV